MPIRLIDEQRRLREAGRIRIGEKIAGTTKAGKDYTRPAKLETFRFTSPDKAAIMRLAELYGGEARLWDDAPVGEQFEVITTSKVIEVLVPPTEFAFTQWLELWSGGGCKRRCDGEHEYITDGPCICAEEAEEKPKCRPHTRLSLILTALNSMGVWRLDTQGQYAAVELNGAIEIVKMAAAKGRMLPARLLLEQRESKKPGEAALHYAVPVLDLAVSLMELAGVAAPGLTPIPQVALPSLAESLQEAEEPAQSAPRANAAAPLPSTGLKPRRAAEIAPPTDDGPASDAQLEAIRKLAESRAVEVPLFPDGKDGWTMSEASSVIEQLNALADAKKAPA